MRRQKTYTVTADGRDKDKSFLLTEMSAASAEEWAIQAFLALANENVDIGDIARETGMAGIAALGLQALGKLRYHNIKPLMDRMFDCVQALPSGPGRPELARGLVENDIEEVATRMALRLEVFSLHAGFSLPGAPLTGSTSGEAPGDSRAMKTSPPSSALSSRQARRA